MGIRQHLRPGRDPRQVHNGHKLRGDALRRCADEGVAEAEIERHGGYRSHSTMRNSYLTGPTCKAARAMAEFPQEEGHFFIARGLVRPPQQFVDGVFSRLLKNAGTILDPKYKYAKHVCQASVQFVQCAKQLASEFLQDAAVMWTRIRDNPIFSYPPFDTAEFHEFR
ncbi:MAG: hypothetical protein AAF368_03320 [Planctomycetota bacterium]